MSRYDDRDHEPRTEDMPEQVFAHEAFWGQADEETSCKHSVFTFPVLKS